MDQESNKQRLQVIGGVGMRLGSNGKKQPRYSRASRKLFPVHTSATKGLSLRGTLRDLHTARRRMRRVCDQVRRRTILVTLRLQEQTLSGGSSSMFDGT